MSRTMMTTRSIKVLPYILNGYPYNCPAADEEDIAEWKWGTAHKFDRSEVDFREVLNKDIKGIGWLRTKRITRLVIQTFFDKVITDVIMNNTVFVLPFRFVYIVCAQRQAKKSPYYHTTQQREVRVFFCFSKKGFKFANKRYKFVSLSYKYKKMLMEELKKGRIYPRIEDIYDKMNDYVNQPIRESVHGSRKA